MSWIYSSHFPYLSELWNLSWIWRGWGRRWKLAFGIQNSLLYEALVKLSNVCIKQTRIKGMYIVQPSQNQCLWIVRPLWTKSYRQCVHLLFLKYLILLPYLFSWIQGHCDSCWNNTSSLWNSVTLCQLHYSIPFDPVPCFPVLLLHFGRGSEPPLEDRALCACSRSLTRAPLWCFGQVFVNAYLL